MSDKLFSYRTEFHLECPINGYENIEAAREYLSDKMETYLKSHVDYDHEKGETTIVPDDIEQIRWVLREDGDGGFISLLTTRDLSEKELKYISEWVRGQNSDGLGEGFEQQEFALYVPCDYDDYCDDYDDPDECDCSRENCPNAGMCSFDWMTNDYIFSKC